MKYFEKQAFRFNKPGLIKKFNLLTEKEMTGALLRQPLPRKIFGIWKTMTKLVDEKGEFAAARKTYRELAKVVSKRKAAGTFFSTPKGKSIGISKETWKEAPGFRRNILAHEAFHANVPVLGHSEILAHTYGGAKAGRGLKESLKGGAAGLGGAVLTRPGRVGIEVGLVGAGVVGTGIGIKKVKKKYFGKQPGNKA